MRQFLSQTLLSHTDRVETYCRRIRTVDNRLIMRLREKLVADSGPM